MKKSRFLLLSIFFCFVTNISLEFKRKQKVELNSLQTNKNNDSIREEKIKEGGVESQPDVDGDTCVIFSSSEGNSRNCWCPRGYILCNEEDVLDVQDKLNEIKNKHERSLVTPLWMKRLCDNSKDVGFKSMSVVIDYELAVLCKDGSNKDYADFEIIGASGYITGEEMIEQQKRNPWYVPRKCTVNNFYLCRKVENDNVHCSYTPWSDWSTCKNNTQKRYRKVSRSNQNNENFCLWNDKIVPRNIMEQTRSC
ncbi:secreted protein with altered thrombospondin repeat domain [Plasmodium sp. DRC-Itaito]|nr:secreted protein with altered thrombospondin repeat domain [Plasmodium sp. DRC-Itaito]